MVWHKWRVRPPAAGCPPTSCPPGEMEVRSSGGPSRAFQLTMLLLTSPDCLKSMCILTQHNQEAWCNNCLHGEANNGGFTWLSFHSSTPLLASGSMPMYGCQGEACPRRHSTRQNAKTLHAGRSPRSRIACACSSTKSAIVHSILHFIRTERTRQEQEVICFMDLLSRWHLTDSCDCAAASLAVSSSARGTRSSGSPGLMRLVATRPRPSRPQSRAASFCGGRPRECSHSSDASGSWSGSASVCLRAIRRTRH